MRDNKKILIFCLLISSLLISIGKASELFNFKIKEIQITQDGNLIKGFKGGEANTDDGISIKANYFEYDKSSTVLKTEQNVRLVDNIRLSEPNFIYIDIYRMLNDPITSYWRIEKY